MLDSTPPIIWTSLDGWAGVSSLRDGGYARQYNAERHIPPAEVSGVTGQLSPGHAGCEHEPRRKHGGNTKSHNSHVAQQGLQYILRQVPNLQGKTSCISGAFSRLKYDPVVWSKGLDERPEHAQRLRTCEQDQV
jgi:hypothetical protein